MKPSMFGAPGLGIAVATLSAVVVAEAAYTMHLHRQLANLSDVVEAADTQPGTTPQGQLAPKLPVPRLRTRSDETADAPAPAPAVQALVRTMVAEEIERRTWEKEARKSARTENAYSEVADSLTTVAAVQAGNAEKVEQILVGARETQRELRLAERADELSTDEATEALSTLRTDTTRRLAELLGDDWAEKMAKAREHMREARSQQRELRGGGGVFWFLPRG